MNKQTDAFGNRMVYAYHEDELSGVRYPQEIRYGDDGDARLLFEYVARSDLAAVTLASVAQETRVLLHTVRAALDAHSVRAYRMKSETSGGRRQLDKIQLCGFDEESGTSYKCLRPLDIDWEAPPMSLPVDKVLLAKITDPLGRETTFDYGGLTTGATHDFLFSERPFGNATTPTDAAGANVTSRTSRALFDADEARYPRALRNPLGQEHSLVHDKRFGLVKRATDPNNRAAMIAYDPFGREESRTTPDSVAVATSHEWCGTGANKVACATVGAVEPVARARTSSPIHPTETRYLDKLGRVIRTEVKSFDGTTERREDIVYDARGRVDRVSQPHHAGDTAIVYAVNPDLTEPDRDHQVG